MYFEACDSLLGSDPFERLDVGGKMTRVIETSGSFEAGSFQDLVDLLRANHFEPRKLFVALAVGLRQRLDSRLVSEGNADVSAMAGANLMAAALAMPEWLSDPGPMDVHELRPDVLDALCAAGSAIVLDDGGRDFVDADEDRLRTLAQLSLQRVLQWDMMSVTSHFLLIAGLLGESAFGLDPEPLAKLVLEQAVYSDSERFLRAMFVVLAAGLAKPIVRPSQTFRPIEGTELHSAALAVLNQLSVSGEEAHRELAIGRHSNKPGFARAFSLFRESPYIRLDDDLFVAVAPAFLMAGVALFPYLELRKQSATVDFGTGTEMRVDNPFTIRMGQRFEAISIAMLRLNMPKFYYYGERVVWRRKNQEVKSPDGLFISPDGRTVVLVQAKLRPPHWDFWYGARTDLDNALSEPFASMVIQNLRFLRAALDQGGYAVNDESQAILSAVSEADTWLQICVSPVLPSVFHYPYIGDRLSVVVRRRAIGALKKICDEPRLNTIYGKPYFARLEELEFLAALPEGHSHPDVYREWRDYLRVFSFDGPRRFGTDHFPADYRDFMAYRFAGELRRPEALSHAYKRVTDDTLAEYRQLVGEEQELE